MIHMYTHASLQYDTSLFILTDNVALMSAVISGKALLSPGGR